jgi:chaperonin GroEL (HSP60 family)
LADKEQAQGQVEERLAALVSNANAIRMVASAVEGTLGAKGLNVMLVDRFGDTTVTNDGITILRKIDTNHPAARMLINAARAQEDEVGDGTTTTAVIASALVSEGLSRVARGVPVTKVIEGMKRGLEQGIRYVEAAATKPDGLESPLLRCAAVIAGRENEEIADLVVEAARMIGEEKLRERDFRLLKTVLAKEGAENEVFLGLILDKSRLSRQMPKEIHDARVLVIDDGLEPETVEDDALGTESGFARYMQLREEFVAGVHRLIDVGVNAVFAAKGIDELAEEIFVDNSVLAVRRVSGRDISKLAEHTGARTIRRAGLKRDPDELAACLGRCERVYEDERLEHVRVLGGAGKPVATILVGAATEEVRDERERIAKDAASAVQGALLGGVVPGGGAIEIAAARSLLEFKDTVKGMASHGVDCVIEALRRPLAQMVANAGFNPLEKVEDVIAAQASSGSDSLAIDCDSGEVADMVAMGVVDPAPVKTYALRSAGEVAEAVLRINTIIRKREEPKPAGEPKMEYVP